MMMMMIAMMEKTVKSLKHCADVMFLNANNPCAAQQREPLRDSHRLPVSGHLSPSANLPLSDDGTHGKGSVRVSVRRKIWKPYHTLSITVQPLIYLET